MSLKPPERRFFTIIINYNKLSYQRRLLDNIPRGTDVLFVDDASRDGSFEAALAFFRTRGSSFHSVAFLQNDKNLNIFDTRLAAMEYVAGFQGFFTMVDADDVLVLGPAFVSEFLEAPIAPSGERLADIVKFNAVLEGYTADMMQRAATPLYGSYTTIEDPVGAVQRYVDLRLRPYVWGHVFSTQLAGRALGQLRTLAGRRIGLFDDVFITCTLLQHARSYDSRDEFGLVHLRNGDSVTAREWSTRLDMRYVRMAEGYALQQRYFERVGSPCAGPARAEFERRRARILTCRSGRLRGALRAALARLGPE